jgi:phage terminase large subunit-like protein
VNDPRALANDPQAFREHVIRIDVDGELQPYGPMLTTRQRDNHAATDPALLAITGRGSADGVRFRFWREETRGCAKSTGAAADFLFLLFASTRKIDGVHAACDREQAQLLLTIIESMVQASPLLSHLIVVEKGKVWNRSTGSTLTVISSDVNSSFGFLVDWISIDEIAVWGEDKRRLWGSLISTAGKRARCLVTVTTNAGWRTSWQFVLREKIRQDPEWAFSHYGHPPEWMTERAVAEQRRLLTAPEFTRLLDPGQWQDDDGMSLDEQDLDAAVVLSGPADGRPHGPQSIWIGLDMGDVHDAAAIVCATGDVMRQKIVVLGIQRWLPRDFVGGRIQQSAVKEGILEFRERFDATAIKSDAWQSIGLMQDVAKLGLFNIVQCVQPTSKAKDEACKALVQALRDRQVELFDGELVTDLRRAQVVERASGLKLVYPRNEFGHCDLAAAFEVLIVDLRNDLPIHLAEMLELQQWQQQEQRHWW